MGRFNPRKEFQDPLHSGGGGVDGVLDRAGEVQKISPPSEFDPPTAQAVVQTELSGLKNFEIYVITIS
jgi:hypothetical protein